MAVLVRKSSLRTWLAAGAALLAAVLAPPATAEEPVIANRAPTIVFVCLHGSVKSQMAAAHFNRIARERGLPYSAVSRGIDVDTSIPTRIRDGLSLDGLAPTNDVPRGLTPEEAEGATKVVAFDQVPDEKRGISEVTYWTDVPLPTRDYEGARDVIVGHIDSMLPALQRAPVQEILRGVIENVDQRNDQISVRLTSGGGPRTREFKVQDGMLFDAVRYGDQIEFTVQTIDGAKTIVSLRRE